METVGLTTHQTPVRFNQRPGAELAAAQAGPQPSQATQLSQAVKAVQQPEQARLAEEKPAKEPEVNPAAKEAAKFSTSSTSPDPIPAELSAAERSAAYAQLLGGGIAGDSSEAVKLFLRAQNLFTAE